MHARREPLDRETETVSETEPGVSPGDVGADEITRRSARPPAVDVEVDVGGARGVRVDHPSGDPLGDEPDGARNLEVPERVAAAHRDHPTSNFGSGTRWSAT